MSAFVDVYDKTTGKLLENWVPKEWLEHPILGANITDKPVINKLAPTVGGNGEKQNG